MKKENNQSSMASLILIMLVVVIGVFWLKPNWDEASALSVTRDARETDKKLLEDKLKNLEDAKNLMDQGSEINQQTVLTAIPEKFQQDQLLNQITTIAKQYDVNMSSISFSVPLNSVELLKKATVNVSMTGNEDDLLRFLKGLENNPRKLIVKNVTVQFGTTSGLARVNFNVSLETYYQGSI